MNSIETRSLCKEFGKVRAVDDVTLDVGESEIFGFLGHNGAGKSTTMMILTTLLRPTSGTAVVAGHDVTQDPGAVRRSIGYVQQETTVDEYLTGRENLQLQARLSHIPGSEAGGRIDEILGLIGLDDKQDEAVITYSGGMRKRLDIAGGLLHRPRILFLDEPTVGPDIQTRRKIWEYVRDIHDKYGMTIFLSTHYMEEADRLCDRIAIVDHGKIQAVGRPSEMKDALGREAIRIDTDGADRLAGPVRGIDGVTGVEEREGGITVYASNGTRVIPRIFELAAGAGTGIDSISMTRPTLDDVYVSYTGRQARDGGGFDRKREHAKMRRLRP